MRESSDPRGQMGPETSLEGCFLSALESQPRRTVLLHTGVGWGFWQGRERKQVSFSE